MYLLDTQGNVQKSWDLMIEIYFIHQNIAFCYAFIYFGCISTPCLQIGVITAEPGFMVGFATKFCLQHSCISVCWLVSRFILNVSLGLNLKLGERNPERMGWKYSSIHINCIWSNNFSTHQWEWFKILHISGMEGFFKGIQNSIQLEQLYSMTNCWGNHTVQGWRFNRIV